MVDLERAPGSFFAGKTRQNAEPTLANFISYFPPDNLFNNDHRATMGEVRDFYRSPQSGLTGKLATESQLNDIVANADHYPKLKTGIHYLAFGAASVYTGATIPQIWWNKSEKKFSVSGASANNEWYRDARVLVVA